MKSRSGCEIPPLVQAHWFTTEWLFWSTSARKSPVGNGHFSNPWSDLDPALRI